MSHYATEVCKCPGKRGAFLPQILNSANTHRDTIQVLQRQEQELRTRIAKHLSGQVRAPGASLIIGYGCKHGWRWRSVPARSGASQFALWASADDRHDTLSCFDWFSTNLRRPACGTNPWHPQHFSTEQAFRIRERLIERKDNNWGSTPFKSDAIYARTTCVKPWCHANSRRYTRKQGLPNLNIMVIYQTTWRMVLECLYGAMY